MATVDLPERYLRCRAMRHAWDDYSPIDGRAPEWGAAMYWRCTRCAMVRRDVISLIDGALLGRTYEPPPGYRYGPDDEKPTALDYRLAMLRLRKPGAVSGNRGARQRRAAS